MWATAENQAIMIELLKQILETLRRIDANIAAIEKGR